MNKKSVASWAIVFIVVCIIVIVFTFIFLYKSSGTTERAYDFLDETGLRFQSVLTICTPNVNTTYARFGGWGRTTDDIINSTFERAVGGRKGLYALYVKYILDEPRGNFGIGLTHTGTLAQDNYFDMLRYPYMSFSYKIKKDTPLCLIGYDILAQKAVVFASTKAASGAWDCGWLAMRTDMTPDVEVVPIGDGGAEGNIFVLLNDGKWHDADLNYVDSSVISILYFFNYKKAMRGDEFWIDEFVISSDQEYKKQIYCAGFEDKGAPYV